MVTNWGVSIFNALSNSHMRLSNPFRRSTRITLSRLRLILTGPTSVSNAAVVQDLFNIVV